MNLESVFGAWWSFQLFANSLGDWVIALSVFLVLLLIFRLFQAYVVGRVEKIVEKTHTQFDDVFLRILATVRPPFYLFLAFYLAVRWLDLPAFGDVILNGLLVAWAALQVILALQVAVGFIIDKKIASEEHPSHKSMLGALRTVAGVILWILGILFVLSNLGVNVTSLLAGLGIGGIAVALAAQNILSDLFNSIVIYFDQPFSPGDYIVVGKDQGTVEKVGLKTTRIKALSGEQIIIPNKDIAASRINNYKRLERRRVSFDIGIVYETSNEKLEKIPGIIEEVVSGVHDVDFSRAHFHKFADSSLVFTVVYFVEKSDFSLYMDVHQDILLGIKRRFEEAGIEFAYPTQRNVA